MRQSDERRPACAFRLARVSLCPPGRSVSPSLLFFVHLSAHATAPTPPADLVRLMAHPQVIQAFIHFVRIRLYRDYPLHWLYQGCLISKRQLSRYVAACAVARASDQSPPFPTGTPVYGRACPGQGLPRPRSAITTRPNHPLPRQDSHLQACQRPKAAHKVLDQVCDEVLRRLPK